MTLSKRNKKSTSFCADCYGNNPFQQNEGIIAFSKMYPTTNCNSCKDTPYPSPGQGNCCEEPEHSGIYTSGCIEGYGTKCDPLRIKENCLPSGGCDCDCTVTVSGCCDYELNDIIWGTFFFELTQEEYIFEEAQLSINVQRTSGGVDSILFNLITGTYTKQEFIDLLFDAWTPEAGITTIQKTDNGLQFQITTPTSSVIAMSIPSPSNGDCSSYIVSGDYTITSGNDVCNDGGFIDFNAIAGTKFEVKVGEEWIPETQDALSGSWESLCDKRNITEWRILDSQNNVLQNQSIEPVSCEEDEIITKSICEHIQYLYSNESGSIAPNTCTLEVGGCCDYSVEGIDLRPRISFTVPDLEPQLFDGGGFSIVVYIEPDVEFYFLLDNIDPNIAYTSEEIIAIIQSTWIENEYYELIIDGNNVSIVSKTEDEHIINFDYDNSILPETPYSSWDFSNYNIIQSNFAENEVSFGYSFQSTGILLTFEVLINSVWTDVTDEVVDGTWTSLNDCRTITDWRIVDAEDNVIDSGEVTKNNCGTTETKSTCEWLQEHQTAIKELQDSASGNPENIYTSDGTLTEDRTLEGDDYFLNFLNLRYFSLEAQPQEGDSYGIALGNNQSGDAKSNAGVIIGGKGKNQGVVISGLTEGQDGAGTSGIQITGENSSPSGEDILITPQNGTLKIQNIDDDILVKFYGVNADGRLKKQTLPTIPTNNNQLTNGAEYITSAALAPLAFFNGNAGHTGDTNETIVQTIAVAPSAWATNAVYQILARVTRLAGSVTFRVRMNTSADLTGTPITLLEFVVSAGSHNPNRLLIKTGNNFEYSTITTISDLIAASTTATTTVNTSNPVYIMLTIQGGTAAASGNFSTLNIHRQ